MKKAEVSLLSFLHPQRALEVVKDLVEYGRCGQLEKRSELNTLIYVSRNKALLWKITILRLLPWTSSLTELNELKIMQKNIERSLIGLEEKHADLLKEFKRVDHQNMDLNQSLLQSEELNASLADQLDKMRAKLQAQEKEISYLESKVVETDSVDKENVNNQSKLKVTPPQKKKSSPKNMFQNMLPRSHRKKKNSKVNQEEFFPEEK